MKGFLAMSKRKVQIKENQGIEYNGSIYPLVFNLNVMEQIQEEYETIDHWGDLTDGKSHELNAKALKFGLTAMLNEGVDMWNEENENKRDFFTTKQVGRIITELGLAETAKRLNTTVIESSKSDEKNA